VAGRAAAGHDNVEGLVAGFVCGGIIAVV